MVLKKNNKGAQGIGTLIIFIAMILVAAVAAGVLIQTASSLQSKSLDVGRQSQEKITSDIEVVQVYAYNTSDNNITAGNSSGNEDSIVLVVRLGSGSNPIKLNDLLLRFDSQAGTQATTYVGAYNYSNGAATYNVTNYAVVYKVKGSNHQPDYLSVGDLAEIQFAYGMETGVGEDIREGETATLRLISKNGAVKPIQITTPSAMTEYITYLYP